MRGATRRASHEEEEESAFVSMTDLTVSFLFIVIILLAFFASQLKDEKTVPEPLYSQLKLDRNRVVNENAELRRQIEQLEAKLRRPDPLQTYLTSVSVERDRILRALRERLLVDFPELKDIVSIEADALRFKGDGLFASSKSELSDEKRRIVEAIAVRLSDLLPCYTFGRGSRWSGECNAAGAVIEAVQIEGHTDASGQSRSNFELSANRAIQTLFAMTGSRPELLGFQNILAQPVISFAGYGPLRPVADNRTEVGRATNRRIDLRIIMYTPQNIPEVERVKDSLRRGMSGTTLQ